MTEPMREAPLPFYLGTKAERRLTWWQRRRRKRLLRQWIRAGRPETWGRK